MSAICSPFSSWLISLISLQYGLLVTTFSLGLH